MTERRPSAGPPNRAPHRRGSPIKYTRILHTLRRQILAGQWAVGHRVPTRRALARQFATTTVTIQRALDVLAAEGLVRVDARRGTYVANHRPTRADYALAFPWPKHEDVSQFYRALRQQAEQLTNAQRQISCFDEITGRRDTEDYQRLEGWVRSHRLAGVIFASHPHVVAGLPVLEEPGVPRVLIAAPTTTFALPCVYPDLEAFYQRAFAQFAAAGRRRVAAIILPTAGDGRPLLDQLRRLASACGLQIEPRWVQSVPAQAPYWARHVAEILFQGRAADRPDALLITDDNLVPEATAGLVAAGVRVPREAMVIAHTNFPYPTPAAVPVTRLGFDISHLLELCVERIDQQRRGETAAVATLLPAVNEGELKQPVLLRSTIMEGVRV